MEKRKLQKLVKKTNKTTLILAILFLLFGIGGGIGTVWYITKNDTFTLNGDSEIVLNVGDTYIEQNAVAIAFGKDISNGVQIEGEVDTTKEGEFVLEYEIYQVVYYFC